MDVIEDLVTFLRVVLDYVGIDADDLGDYLQDLNTRQREALHRFGRTVLNHWDQNITQRRIRTAQNWYRWRSDIRHRSLVRIVGTSLPLKPPKRIRFQKHLLRPRHRLDSLESNVTSLSFTSTGSIMDDDRDLVWVEEELGDNCVRVRAQAREDMNTESEDEFDPSMFDNRLGTISPMSSTMISSVSTLSSYDPTTMSKINVLEEELTNLRQQIAGLVLNQEQFNKSQVLCKETTLSDCSTPPSQCQVPPPPPPLPPLMGPSMAPPIPVQKSTPVAIYSQKESDLEHKIQTTIDKTNSSTPEISKNHTNPPSLTEVLQGLSTVKLRAIQRSPGGTPLKTGPLPAPSNNCNDPAFLIAQALKKKFAHRQFDSPDVDKENDSHDFSSADENSPYFKGESHFVKKTKKRSLLFHDRRKSSGPLTEVNA